ncbi:hypothetical protein ACFLQR_02110 [Verrucomicrobiota bacterium]
MKTTDISKQDTDNQQLDSFIRERRLDALERLASQRARDECAPCSGDGNEQVNMHVHSFFSYNTEGYSPCHIAWESREAGLYAAGLCDFDVLDGLEEFIKAGLVLGLRTAVHLETRAYLKEYATVDINSLGEQGVAYIMGAGFARAPDKASPEAATLVGYRRQADERNLALVGRINDRLPAIAVDYEKEVVPLTPAGCPTERHIVRAFRLKTEAVFESSPVLFNFWAELMNQTPAEVEKLYSDTPALENKIRSVLVKAGGVGYEQPTEKTFPPVDDFINWVLACGAIPMVTWLDGTSKGEENILEMLECMNAKGTCALNIIPDRNHNISDPDTRAVKMRKLGEVIQAAEQLWMPINIGTEMNKQGQPFADDTRCDALRPYQLSFLRGARIMVGHTWLLRFAGFSYVGEAAKAEFGDDIKEKNDFFESVGSLPPLTVSWAGQLEDMGGEKAFAEMRNSASKGEWLLK